MMLTSTNIKRNLSVAESHLSWEKLLMVIFTMES